MAWPKIFWGGLRVAALARVLCAGWSARSAAARFAWADRDVLAAGFRATLTAASASRGSKRRARSLAPRAWRRASASFWRRRRSRRSASPGASDRRESPSVAPVRAVDAAGVPPRASAPTCSSTSFRRSSADRQDRWRGWPSTCRSRGRRPVRMARGLLPGVVAMGHPSSARVRSLRLHASGRRPWPSLTRFPARSSSSSRPSRSRPSTRATQLWLSTRMRSSTQSRRLSPTALTKFRDASRRWSVCGRPPPSSTSKLRSRL
mmetsp:Transcript_14192/g.48853  ORF Transcript_14192/g.48853 Transcript_14192/m.48853 type:complete len:262 (-) Transcript_14192:675-1460(-)